MNYHSEQWWEDNGIPCDWCGELMADPAFSVEVGDGPDHPGRFCSESCRDEALKGESHE